MERLWAPWRFEYVRVAEAQNSDVNIFVELPNAGDDARHLILFRGRTAFVMLNAYPYTCGHLLIAPYRQVADVVDLTDDELLEINQLVAAGVRWVRAAYAPDGFNIGVNMGRAAGAGIPVHVHWHVVPRWNGDTNFMGAVAETRVIPEATESAYARLRAVIEGGQ